MAETKTAKKTAVRKPTNGARRTKPSEAGAIKTNVTRRTSTKKTTTEDAFPKVAAAIKSRRGGSSTDAPAKATTSKPRKAAVKPVKGGKASPATKTTAKPSTAKKTATVKDASAPKSSTKVEKVNNFEGKIGTRRKPRVSTVQPDLTIEQVGFRQSGDMITLFARYSAKGKRLVGDNQWSEGVTVKGDTLADRVTDAIYAGKVFTEPTIIKGEDGKSKVVTKIALNEKRANSTLTKWGF